MSKYLCLLYLCLLVSRCMGVANHQQNNFSIKDGQGWSVQNLDIEVELSSPSNPKFVARLDLILSHADSSFGPSLVINSIRNTMKFSDVVSEDHQVAINVPGKGDRLLAKFERDRAHRKGDKISVTCHFERDINESLLFYWSNEYALSSWINAWYPTPFGQQDSAAWLALRAPGKLSLTLPPNWKAISGGKKIKERGNQVVFEFDGSVARSFAAGPFDVYARDMGKQQMEIYSVTNRSKGKGHVAKSFLKALDVLETKFGPAPYAYKAIVEVPYEINGFYGASEQQYILLKPGAFDDELNGIPVLAHEAAHAWWATLISVNYEEAGAMWMSESMAQYSAFLAIEELFGKQTAKDFFVSGKGGFSRNHDAGAYFRLVKQGKDRNLKTPADGSKELHYLADSKGAWVYHMLRVEMGDEAFFEAIRESVNRYRNNSITLAQWLEVFEEFSEYPLDDFFEQWLDRTGAPKITTLVDGNDIEIKQENELPYNLLLEMQVTYTDGSEETIQHRITRTSQRLSMKKAVSHVVLDPNHDLLLWNEWP